MIDPWKIQGSEDWHAFRENKIGGSMAPTIMGENPYSSPYRLWQEMTGRKEVFISPAMRRGTEFEP